MLQMYIQSLKFIYVYINISHVNFDGNVVDNNKFNVQVSSNFENLYKLNLDQQKHFLNKKFPRHVKKEILFTVLSNWRSHSTIPTSKYQYL